MSACYFWPNSNFGRFSDRRQHLGLHNRDLNRMSHRLDQRLCRSAQRACLETIEATEEAEAGSVVRFTSILFSNGSRAEALRVSTLSGTCVLCVLVRHSMG